jgi:medium-chain acyl-[acyl-carrier-protein] hydrolase
MDERTRAARRTWFPAVRPREGARRQLFCFPFAGGGASAYRLWREHFPPWIEVWPVEYPGHETRFREPAIDNAEDLASALAEQIAAAADLPFAIFGHSMGALLAFETVRTLRLRHGLQPAALFVSGFSAPHLKALRPPIRNLPETAFREELRRYGGTPEPVLADEEFMQFLSPLLRRDLGICETYDYQVEPALSVPIIAFRGADDPTVPWGRLLDWAEHTAAAFRAHVMPGKHFFVRETAPRICTTIAQDLEGGSWDVHLTPPRRGEAHLWTVRLDRHEGGVACLAEILSDDERHRADAYVHVADRLRYTVTRAALRTLLGRYGGVPPDTIGFSYSSSGKPRCEALRPLDFNVSHSGDLALIAFTTGGPVGVDVEHVRRDLDFAGVGRQVFTNAEIEQLAGMAETRRGAAFFDLWVRKEAYFKRSGEGLGGPLRQTYLGLGPSFRSGEPMAPSAAAPGTLHSFSPAADYAGALATGVPLEQTIIRQWRGDDGRRKTT